MKRILVCGGRKYADYAALAAYMDQHYGPHSDGDHYDISLDLMIISGWNEIDKIGADALAARWAKKNDAQYRAFPAAWTDLSHPTRNIRTRRDGTEYDALAGLRRNQQMLDVGEPTRVVAFPGGSGTADMIRRAERAGLVVDRVP